MRRGGTLESFLEMAKEDSAEVIGEWLGPDQRILCRCRCGLEWGCLPWGRTRVECKDCSLGRRAEVGRKKFGDFVESCGWFIAGEYSGMRNKVELVCPEGHTSEVVARNFQRNPRCYACDQPDRASKSRESGRDRFMREIGRQGITLLGEYVSSTQPVKCLCPEGHECSLWPQVLRSGKTWCRKCGFRRISEIRLKRGEERLKESLTSLGWRMVGEYSGWANAVLLECPEGHQHDIHPGAFLSLLRCTTCAARQDRVYLIKHPTLEYAKIGICGGANRLEVHERRGWQVIWIFDGFSGSQCRAAERSVLTTLRSWGFESLAKDQVPYGDGWTETFSIDALDIVLDVLAAQGLSASRDEVISNAR